MNMRNNKKYLLAIAVVSLFSVLSTGCSKEDLIEPCNDHEEPVYRGYEDAGTEGMGGISDGGDDESDSERNNKQQ